MVSHGDKTVQSCKGQGGGGVRSPRPDGKTSWKVVAGAELREWQRMRNAKWGTAYLAEVWVHEGRKKKRNLRADHAEL